MFWNIIYLCVCFLGSCFYNIQCITIKELSNNIKSFFEEWDAIFYEQIRHIERKKERKNLNLKCLLNLIWVYFEGGKTTEIIITKQIFFFNIKIKKVQPKKHYELSKSSITSIRIILNLNDGLKAIRRAIARRKGLWSW